MLKITDIKEIIKSNSVCYFCFYKKNVLYYSFYFNNVECIFPIPLEDLCSTQMNISEKTIKYMGYINDAIKKELIIYKELD